MALEEFAEFLAGAEGADFDIRGGPAGGVGNFCDRAFLEVEHGDDEAVFRAEGGEGGAEAVRCFAGGGGGVRGGIRDPFEGFRFAAGGEEGVAAAAFLEVGEAGIDGDAGDPVGEGGVEAVGLEAAPEVHEDFLAEVIEFRGALDVAGGHGGDAAFAGAHDGVKGRFVALLGGADEVCRQRSLIELLRMEADWRRAGKGKGDDGGQGSHAGYEPCAGRRVTGNLGKGRRFPGDETGYFGG
jgi:hypothetical protein